MNRFEKLFDVRKPIIGMIHLAGENSSKRVGRAITELEIYTSSGVDGAILEDYHGRPQDVLMLLRELKGNYPFPLGINILREPILGFKWAVDYGLSYVQFYSVYERDIQGFNQEFDLYRKKNPNIEVLGGVRFKDVPLTGRTLEEDIEEAMFNSDVLVTTGDATGLETDLDKLKLIKQKMSKDVPLLVGSGLNANNAYEQLLVADGAIVGSSFKNNYTQDMIIEERVCDLMDEVFRLRGCL